MAGGKGGGGGGVGLLFLYIKCSLTIRGDGVLYRRRQIPDWPMVPVSKHATSNTIPRITVKITRVVSRLVLRFCLFVCFLSVVVVVVVVVFPYFTPFIRKDAFRSANHFTAYTETTSRS